jgi:hypothetical protein
VQVISYPNHGSKTLSDSHQGTLYVDSGIDPPVEAERGTFTASRGKDVPQDHGWLPKKPGILFPVHTLDGGIFYRLRPDNPGRFPKYMQPKGHPNRLDVHPRQHERIRQSGGMRYVTEGEKKVDAGVSRGLLMVGLSGVWNGQKDKALIPDWHLLPLEGERYSITFDSDITSNPDVKMGGDRQARLLREQGAEVFITLLPPAPDGSKQGLDDFFANGGTVKELELLTSPYDPETVERARLTRDEKLRAGAGYLWRDWHERDWMHFVGDAERPNWQRGHTARDVMEALIELAAQIGKVEGHGIVVRVGLRRLAELSAKSTPSVGHAVKHLEADGQLEILPAEDRCKSRKYRLLVPRAALYSMEKGHTERTRLRDGAHRCKGLRAPTAPRLRWSSPARKVQRLRGVTPDTRRVRQTRRFHKDLTMKESRDHFPDWPYIKRLGPHRCAILDALEDAGGWLTLQELCEVLHRSRPRDVRRRLLPMLEEAGIIVCEGDVIRLVADWLEKLEEARERKGEISHAEKQRKDHCKQRQRYRDYLESVKHQASRAARDAVHQGHKKRKAGLVAIAERAAAAAKAEEQRKAEAFVCDRLRELGRIRLGLLQDVARDEGLDPWSIPRAVEALGYRVERLAEFENERFVFAPVEGAA